MLIKVMFKFYILYKGSKDAWFDVYKGMKDFEQGEDNKNNNL